MSKETSWKDEDWTKKHYQEDAIYKEVEEQIRLLVTATIGNHDFKGLSPDTHRDRVCRQVALALYSNLKDKFKPSSKEDWIDLTKSQPSHWNFVLLGKAGPVVWSDNNFACRHFREEQQVTPYFLIKLAHRLRLQSIEVNWEAIKHTLLKGGRWRVISSPATPQARKRWAPEFEKIEPTQKYPAPWKIANMFSIGPFKDEIKGKECEVMMPCRVQNDGVMYIPKDGLHVDPDGNIEAVWVLKGIEPPQTPGRNPAHVRADQLDRLLDAAMKKLGAYELDLAKANDRIKELEDINFHLDASIQTLKAKLDRPMTVEIEIDPLTGNVKRVG